MKKYVQFRLWENTLRLLKHISAETGESMIKIVDRLARADWKKVQDSLLCEKEDGSKGSCDR